MNKKIVKNGILFLIGIVVAFIIADFVRDYSKEKELRKEAEQEEVTDNEDYEIAEDTEIKDEEEKDDEEKQENSNKKDRKPNLGPNPGERPYDYFDLEVIGNEEKTIRLEDYKGKKVLLNFWASWCPPCRLEAPELNSFHKNNEDIVIIGVNATNSESKKSNAQDFIDEYDTEYINVYGPDEMMDLFYANSLPTSLLIDSEGVTQERITGAVSEEMLDHYFGTFN